MIVDDSAAVHRRTVRMSGLDVSLKRTKNDLSDAEGEITNRVAEAVMHHSQDQAATFMVSIPPIVQGRVPGNEDAPAASIKTHSQGQYDAEFSPYIT